MYSRAPRNSPRSARDVITTDRTPPASSMWPPAAANPLAGPPITLTEARPSMADSLEATSRGSAADPVTSRIPTHLRLGPSPEHIKPRTRKPAFLRPS
jgi:hypothetical protein